VGKADKDSRGIGRLDAARASSKRGLCLSQKSSGPGGSRSEIEQLCLRNLLTAPEERVFFKDLEGRFLLVSDGWLAAIGHGISLEHVVGKTDFDFFTHPHAAEAAEDERRIIRTGRSIVNKPERETFADRRPAWVSTSRWPLCDAQGEIVGTWGITRDITAQMQDPQTGLANRLALMDRLKQALVRLEREPGRVAVLFLDIDDFKEINDRLGHRVGDAVLVQIAERLTGISRRFDTVCRYGGDEFVLLCTALHDDENVALIGERVASTLNRPIRTNGSELPVRSSIGAVVCSDPLADPEALLDEADTAMYAAKRERAQTIVIYDAERHRPPGTG